VIGQLLHWAFLVTLPVTILLIASGNPIPGVLVFFVGTPILWRLRNRVWFGRPTGDEAQWQDVWASRGLRSNPSTHQRPRLLPPDDELVRGLR
jgi:hypothetical protein